MKMPAIITLWSQDFFKTLSQDGLHTLHYESIIEIQGSKVILCQKQTDGHNLSTSFGLQLQ